MSEVGPRYDQIGFGYARSRREDPDILRRIVTALDSQGPARTLVNVGAGAGSYEPCDRHVVAIEPSDVMAAQRGTDLAPAIRSSAAALPLRDKSVDAGMAVLTIHHWDNSQEQGVRELRRVARGPVVIVSYDPVISAEMWLMRDYLPEVATLDMKIFPAPETVLEWLGGGEIEVIPCRADTPDWHLGSFWAHPERVLDDGARNATSGFARQSEAVNQRVVNAVRRDLESGDWDAKNGKLRHLHEYDVGLRLIVSPGSK